MKNFGMVKNGILDHEDCPEAQRSHQQSNVDVFKQ